MSIITFLNVKIFHSTMIRQVLRTEFAAPRLFAPQSSEKQLHNIHRHGREYCSCQCESNLISGNNDSKYSKIFNDTDENIVPVNVSQTSHPKDII